MKVLRNLARFSVFFKPNPIRMTYTGQRAKFSLATSLTLATAYYYASKKILNDDGIKIFETPDNLGEGQYKEIQVGPKEEDTVIVIKYQGKVYCIQGQCAHFGFSLAKGLLVGDKIMCPLHNAGFSITTGQAEQGPIFSGLKTFPVEVQFGVIKVRIPKQGWQNHPEPVQIDVDKLDKNKKIVIVGGGPAALSAVDTLRKTGYDGYIYMITKEKYGPYDRTMLSKMMDAVKRPQQIRSKQYYQKNGIILVSQANVTGVDYDNKKVQIQNKQPLAYDKLLLATGSVNRHPPIKGLQNVNFLSLRNIQDYQNINKAIRQEGAKQVTIIGAGFIGLEVASAIKLALKDKVNVTIIEQAQVPLQHVFGREVGRVWANLCHQNGVNLIPRAKIHQITGAGKPKAVVLADRQVPADVVIMATGVKTAVDFVPELVDKQNNGVKTNVFLQTDKKDVYAAGDIASYPYWYTGSRARIEHFNEAIYQGSVAGLNMNGKHFPMDNIPFFWTRSFNNSVSVAGYINGWTNVHLVGSVKDKKFIAYYIDNKTDKVLGAASMGIPNAMQIIGQAMRNGIMPRGSYVQSPQFKLEDLVAQLKKSNIKCKKCQNF